MEEIAPLESLLEVQGVDSDIDRLMDRRANLPALGSFKEVHERLRRLQTRLGEERERLREITLAMDRAEGEMALDEEKLEREERRLYAGGLSARDATHLRDEVEMLRRRISGREDEVLELMEQREAFETTVAALEEEATALEAEKARLNDEISAAWKVIDAEVADLKSRKAEMTASADAGLLELYEEIRPGKDGVAIAPLVDRVCHGCHLALSAAEEAQVLKEAPPRCIHCRRILVPR